jgi:hypothetical protein
VSQEGAKIPVAKKIGMLSELVKTMAEGCAKVCTLRACCVCVCVCARRTSISHLLRAPTSACIDKEEKEIPLPNVKLAILNKVVAYLKYRSNPPA